MDKKALVTKYRPLVSLACGCHNLFTRKKIRGSGNRIEASCALFKKVRVEISGDNNVITVEDFSRLKGVSLSIHGSNNRIHIGPWSYLSGTDLFIEDDGGEISLGDHGKLYGRVELAAIEGTKISIGSDCLFSDAVQMRTGDSHSVLDLEGRRINPSRSISVGDHVWFGRNAMLLKGAAVGSHSVVGAGAIVTGQFPEPNCSIAGVPARVLRRGIDWSIKRIPVGEKALDFVPPTPDVQTEEEQK